MNFKLNTILCTTDFSDFSRHIIRYGAGLASRFGARLLIYHAIPFSHDHFYGTSVLKQNRYKEDQTRTACEKIGKLMEGYSLDWTPVVTVGDPVDEIEQTAEEHNADMVVAASYGLSGLNRLFFGTVVERMARALTRPLLVIHQPQQHEIAEKESPLEFRTIVAGCGISSGLGRAVQYALDLGAEFHSAVHLLHALETPVHEDVIDPAQAHYEKVQQELQDRLRQQIAGLVPEQAYENCDVKPVILHGVPGEGISLYAEEIKADLIVVGVKHRTMIEKLLMGSTTEAVIRHAGRPVLIVP